jgi:hypothetical protein
VPHDFCTDHVFVSATARPEARFVDVDATATHRALHDQGARLSPELRALIEEHHMRRIDPRCLPQPRSSPHPPPGPGALPLYGNEPNVIGLRYPSSLDPDAECWAIWDTGEHLPSTYDVAPIDFTNTSLGAAAERLGLALPPT